MTRQPTSGEIMIADQIMISLPSAVQRKTMDKSYGDNNSYEIVMSEITKRLNKLNFNQ